MTGTARAPVLVMHIGDVIAEKYVVEDRVGEGGMGVIYRATQPALQRDVAIKLLRPALADSAIARERFQHEAIAASRAAHRNVVPIIDYGEWHRAPYLVMPFVAGERLGHVLARSGPWALRRIRAVIDQLLAALVATHARSVVHGDIKTSNLIVSQEDERDHLTLMDFGLARLLDQPRIDESRTMSGTPEYLAPEVIGGEPPTPASDLYGVGIILYELLAGSTPFAGVETETVLARQLHEPVPPLAEACPGREIPLDLERLVMRALEKDPRVRITQAATFRDALSMIRLAREPTLPATARSFAADGATLDLADDMPNAIVDAIRHADDDGIIVAHLEHVRSLVDQHRLKSAIDELERALHQLGARCAPEAAPKAMWRLQLMLAALYDGVGDRARARELALAGVEHSRRVGSSVGDARGRALVERLSRRPTRGA